MPWPFFFSVCRLLGFINAMVCSLLGDVLPRFDRDAASLQQATVVNQLAQMLSFGRIHPFL